MDFTALDGLPTETRCGDSHIALGSGGSFGDFRGIPGRSACAPSSCRATGVNLPSSMISHRGGDQEPNTGRSIAGATQRGGYCSVSGSGV